MRSPQHTDTTLARRWFRPGPLIFVGILGFVAGLVWLLATGLRLVRS